MALRIACLGDNCIDRFLPPINHRLAGGNAVNVAVQVVRLGHHAAYFGAIGNDAEGIHLRGELVRNGVNVDGLVVDALHPTAYTDVATSPGGERNFNFEEFGACAAYRADDATFDRLRNFDHVHIGWLNDGGAAKAKLLEVGVSVSQDLSVNNSPRNLNPEGLSVAFASTDPDGARSRAEELVLKRARLAVITMGSAGSLAFDGSSFFEAEALPVEALDTTGAGDSFIAGFLCAHLAGNVLNSALRAGAAHAREACLHLGGFPQTPRPL